MIQKYFSMILGKKYVLNNIIKFYIIKIFLGQLFQLIVLKGRKY